MLGLSKPKKKTGRAKILLVDDEPDLVEIIQRQLELSGWEVITSANGKEGLERAANEKPDLIVLDINMPIMNGHDMLDGLRGNPDLRDTAVIMCTRSGRIQDVTRAMSFNICGYVTKPFDYTELTGKIVEALENRVSD
ncbi:MAG: response regulator [Phycisphaerae bacterium]|nr:response regulator [Phycisphaerae bacterium]